MFPSDAVDHSPRPTAREGRRLLVTFDLYLGPPDQLLDRLDEIQQGVQDRCEVAPLPSDLQRFDRPRPPARPLPAHRRRNRESGHGPGESRGVVGLARKPPPKNYRDP